jgi:hypothetical protein
MSSDEIMNALVDKSKEFLSFLYQALEKSEITAGKSSVPSLFPAAEQGIYTQQRFLELVKKQQPEKYFLKNPIEGNAKIINRITSQKKTNSKHQKPEKIRKSRYNGYLLYYQSVAPQIKKENPEYIFEGLSQIVSRQWRDLPLSEKRQWRLKSIDKNLDIKFSDESPFLLKLFDDSEEDSISNSHGAHLHKQISKPAKRSHSKKVVSPQEAPLRATNLT